MMRMRTCTLPYYPVASDDHMVAQLNERLEDSPSAPPIKDNHRLTVFYNVYAIIIVGWLRRIICE